MVPLGWVLVAPGCILGVAWVLLGQIGGCWALLWCLMGASGGPLGVSRVSPGWSLGASWLAPGRSWVHSGRGLGAPGLISASGGPSAGHGPDSTRSSIFDDFGPGRLPAQISASRAPSARHHPAYPSLMSPSRPRDFVWKWWNTFWVKLLPTAI